MSATVHVSLHTADLHYGGGLVLHTASAGSIPYLRELYLRIADGDCVGVGEVRINISYLTGLAPLAVTNDAINAIRSADWSVDPAELLATMDEWAAAHTAPARSLIDCALHDFCARRAGRSVAAWLGHGAITAVSSKTNQTLFWSPFDRFLQQSQEYVDRGFRDLKVRVAAAEFTEDVRRIAALRERFGDAVNLSADANGNWSAADALAKIRMLAPYALDYIEQPIPAGDWAAVERLANESPIPIMLDEGVAGPADLDRVCGLGGRVSAHLKLVKLGGIGPTVRAARRLSVAGVAFMIGQMNEGAVATAAALHVACATQPAFAELYGADGLIDDPADGIHYRVGSVRADSVPGLGITFDATKAQLVREF